LVEPNEIAQKASDFHNVFTEKLNDMIKDLNNKQPIFVPYDIFKQAMEWNTENMKVLYDVMHEIASEKTFKVDFTIGEFSFSFSGRYEDSKKIIDSAEKMSCKLANKLLKAERIGMLSKDVKRTTDDSKRLYG